MNRIFLHLFLFLSATPIFAQGLNPDQLTPFNTLVEETVYEGR